MEIARQIFDRVKMLVYRGLVCILDCLGRTRIGAFRIYLGLGLGHITPFLKN